MENCPLDVTETDDTIVIVSGNTRLVVKKRPASFTYYYKDRKLTEIGRRHDMTMLSSIAANEFTVILK